MDAISLLIKPASSLCNMRCKYCFYHDVAENRMTPSYGIMTEATVEQLLTRVWEYVGETAQIHFAFQGGEPTLAGLSFYIFFVEQVAKRKLPAQTVSYSIQTNGLVLDEAWCCFLHQHNFLVGLSLDGSAELHDLHRVDSKGVGTYSRIAQSIQCMERHQVEYNILSVVTRAMARKPEKIWNWYVAKRFQYLQFIPCLSPFAGSGEEKYALTPQDYASFLVTTFRGWKRQLEGGNYISVRLFDNLVMLLKGYPSQQCGLLGRCSQQWVIEADGGVYPCDFYVLDDYRCGNIWEMSFGEMEQAPATKAFLQPEATLHPQCATCKVFKLCGGGCKRYRDFYHSKEGYCPYQAFLYAILGELMEVAKKLQ